MQIYRTLLIAAALVAPIAAQPKWYAPDAAAKQSLEDALGAAQKANHRVLVLYEGSWCTLCEQAHAVAMADPEVPNLVHSGYELAHVQTDDTAALGKFAAQELHANLDKSGGLLITILEKDGSVLSTLTGTRLMDKGELSAVKLKTLLSEFLIGPTAVDAYRTALAALPAGKAGWVEFRADWCGWCKKMERFFRESDAAPVLAKYYQVITIDTEKNTGSEQLARSLGSKEGIDGIPWFAVVDRSGKVQATSEGPKGNIGYPDSDVEVAHFLSVLKSTAKAITPAELDTISSTIKALKAKDAKTGSH